MLVIVLKFPTKWPKSINPIINDLNPYGEIKYWPKCLIREAKLNIAYSTAAAITIYTLVINTYLRYYIILY